MSEETCVYLGDGIEDKSKCLHLCRRHGQCLTEGASTKYPCCPSCKDRLLIDDKDFVKKWVDPLEVVDVRREKTTALRNLLAGASAFLVGGGPSANDLPLDQLNRRGIWSLCVNNVAGHERFQPQAFVCSDPPLKFSHSIWLDPRIMKFIPAVKMSGRRAKLRKKLADGSFVPLDRRVSQCPNVWGFKRWSWMTPDDNLFLTEGACWGNHQAGVEKTGNPKTVCTMLIGLRLLRYLGVKRIYLVGVDFHMSPNWGYSFGQDRDDGASNSNNAQFAVINELLCRAVRNGVFERFGVEIYNCYANSGLRAFAHVPFEEAIKDAKGIIEDKPDLARWYQKKDK